MINSQGVSEQLEQMYIEYKHIAAKVHELIAASGNETILIRDANLLEKYPPGTLSYIKEGYLKLKRENREIRMYSTGDFLPPTGNWDNSYRIVSDFRSDIITYPFAELLSQLGEDDELRARWAAMCAYEHRLNLCLCGEYAPEVLELEMIVRNFAKGDVISYPLENGEAVYELISGFANVYLDDVQVGTICANELFGDTELLVPGAAKLKVVAAKNCFVRVLEPQAVTHFLESNGQFAISLLRNLAAKLYRQYQQATTRETPDGPHNVQ